MSEIKLTWLGHSCYILEKDNYKIVLDPFADGSVPGFANVREEADQVLCSHQHGDHGAVECVTIRPESKEKICPFTVTEIESFHDEQHGAKRGPNRIRIFDDGLFRIAHMGDIGCMPDPDQMETLKNLDVMLVPVGGFYTLEPEKVKELIQELKPVVVVPMHYRSPQFGYDVIAPLERFTALCDDVVTYDRNYLLLPQDRKPQTAVLTY